MPTRGRPFQPGNKFGRGRPRGSRNKTSLLAQDIIDSFAEPVVKKCLQKALQGDSHALRLCMDRILPAKRDMPIKLGKLPMATAADLSKASATVVERVAAGAITPTQGMAFTDLIDSRRKVIEVHDIDQRLRAMEGQQ